VNLHSGRGELESLRGHIEVRVGLNSGKGGQQEGGHGGTGIRATEEGLGPRERLIQAAQHPFLVALLRHFAPYTITLYASRSR